MSNNTPAENEPDDTLDTRPPISNRPSLNDLPQSKETRVTHDPLATLASPQELEQTQTHASTTKSTPNSDSRRNLEFRSPRFQILRSHAQGGLGQVWIALDRELNREVALKEIKTAYSDDPVAQARFTREAEITGKLEHPGIVPVYGFGLNPDGHPYYAMRFIGGRSLKTAIDDYHATPSNIDYRGLAFRELIRRFIDVCNTLHYVHHQGVLHRDVKPHNIMVGQYGETLVVDWGLAKKQDEVEQISSTPHQQPILLSGESATIDGSALGTPQYMSPEQAAGNWDQVGPRSDLYSLGATLYHLLTGVNPFANLSVAKVLANVQRGEFQRPRELIPSIPPALESICLKAMQLRPEHRYEDCQALARELERWLADEPVEAHGETFTERWYRRSRRHRAWVMGVATTLPLLFLVLIGAALFVNSERLAAIKQRDLAIEAKNRESEQRLAAQESDRKAREQETIARYQEQQANRAATEAATTLINLLIANGDRAQSDGDWGLAALWFLRALPVVEKHQPATVRGLRIQINRLVDRLHRPVQYHAVPDEVLKWGVISTLSPDGKVSLIRGGAKAIAGIECSSGKLLWKPIAHPALVDFCSFSRDSSHFITASNNVELRVFETMSGKPVGTLIKTDGEIARNGSRTDFALDIDPKHEQIAVATTKANKSRLELLTIQQGNPLFEPIEFDSPLLSVIFDEPHHRLIAVTSSSIFTIDLETHEKQHIPVSIDDIWNVQRSQAGRWLSIASGNGYALVIDLETLNPLGFRCEHSGPVTDTVLSPNERYCASLSVDKTVRIWDLETLKSIGSPLKHRERPWKARFSDDSQTLITVGFDNSVALWNVKSGEPIGAPMVTRSTPEAAVVAQTAVVVDEASCSHWDFSHAMFPYENAVQIPSSLTDKIVEAGYLSSGQVYAVGSQHFWTIEFDLQSTASTLLRTDAPIKSWHVSGDKLKAVFVDQSGKLTWIDIANSQKVETKLESVPLRVRCLPANQWILAAMDDGSIRRYNMASQKWDEKRFEHSTPLTLWDASEDGKRLVVVTANQKLFIWNLITNEQEIDPIDLKQFEIDQSVVGLDLTKDGEVIVVGTQLGQVYVYEPFKKEMSVEKFSLDGAIQQVQFTPDDRHVIASGFTKNVRMWEWKQPNVPSRLFDQDFYSLFAACDPTNTLIATGGLGKVCVFDAQSTRLLCPSLQFRALALSFHPIKPKLLTVDTELRSWDFSEGTRSEADLQLLLHTLTQRYLDDRGVVRFWNAKQMDEIANKARVECADELEPKRFSPVVLKSE